MKFLTTPKILDLQGFQGTFHKIFDSLKCRKRKRKLRTNRKSSKSLYINSFLALFVKKFDSLKCRKKNKNRKLDFLKIAITLDLTRISAIMYIFLIMYIEEYKFVEFYKIATTIDFTMITDTMPVFLIMYIEEMRFWNKSLIL